jgi:dTDP-4-amino-4,6-dideoxygalactose transaminase
MSSTPLFITQPSLPPLEEFLPYLRQIWDRKWLTNAGPFHQELEGALAAYLGVDNLALVTNGTLALVSALQALRITGEVITTPFSFVATAHSLLWNGITPVFADIDPVSLNLDPARVELAVTPKTTAILAVHVYGRPCDTAALQYIADIHGLKLLYDAAHCFGVSQDGQSILRHGDISVLSFHATKVFTTFEGGAIICRDARLKKRIEYLKNFGFVDELTVVAPGINGKMNEFQAALGLLQLRHFEEAITKRRAIDALYREQLAGVPGLSCPDLPPGLHWNFAYFPILVGPEYPLTRDALYTRLKEHDIHVRRYFYPLISEFPMYRGLPSARPESLPVARRTAERVLCLPIYPALTRQDQERILSVILENTSS